MMLIYQVWDIFEVSENLGMNFQLPSFKVSFASSAHLKCETITNFGFKNHVIKRGLVNKTILYLFTIVPITNPKKIPGFILQL